MTDAGVEFNLDDAKAAAGGFVKHIAPFMEKGLVCGSIRRKRPRVHDVDVVAMPKVAKKGDWFGGEYEENLLVSAVDRLIAERVLTPRRKKDGTTMVGKGVAFVEFEGMPVDLYYCASEELWWGLVLVRTGSASHNQSLANMALHQGKRFRADGQGVWDGGLTKRLDDAKSEESIFAALGLRYRPPEAREVSP